MRDPSPYATTDFGRRMYLPNPDTTAQSHIDKCKINYPIQGTAADIMKRAMIKSWKSGDLRLQVHDEMVFDGEVELSKELENIHPEIRTPFSVYEGEKWT